ncbi:MAG: hypothetical protein IJS17_04970, partial [Clostridia bacterium]|nr:hypothetical protein [Clostridia bacterium]
DHFSERIDTEFNYTDEGVHYFEYAVHCSAGEADIALLTREAAAFNIRPVAVPMSYHKGSLPQQNSFVDINTENIIVTAIKFCEDKSGDIIIRLYETEGKDTVFSVRYIPLDISFSAEIKKNEIKTFRCNAESVVETNFLEGIAE